MNLREQFEKETRKPYCIQDLWIPEKSTMPSWDYVRWVEARVAMLEEAGCVLTGREGEDFLKKMKEKIYNDPS